jgi:hypothetical protein
MEPQRVAVFVDLENVPATFLEPIADLADTFGRVCHFAVYADWRQGGNRAAWGTTLDLGGVPKPIMKAGGPNSADISITVDAMEALLSAPELEVFVLVTGDSDFLPLVQKLRSRGKLVVGVVPAGRAVRSVYEAAFDRIERLRHPDEPEGPPTPTQARTPAPTPAPSKPRGAAEAPPKGPTAPTLAATRRALTSLLTREATLTCGEIGEQLRDAVPGFDQRALGFRRLSDMLRAQADLLRVTSQGDVLRVSLVPQPKPAAEPPKAVTQSAPARPAPVDRTDWPGLRDHLLAVLLAPSETDDAADARGASDEALHAAMIARASAAGGSELPVVSVGAIVTRYPSCFARRPDGSVAPIVSLVDAYKLRLNRLWEPLPREVLRVGLARLAGVLQAAGDEPLTSAVIAERLGAASDEELRERDARAVMNLVRRVEGLVSAPSAPNSTQRFHARPWVKDPAIAEAVLDAAALGRMGPYLPVDPLAMAEALGIVRTEVAVEEDGVRF